ncbi:murein L,D-transpeptidase family protein [Flammeovirga sp. OC4]|uniref:L,D-transpeptidase family protein n=1 Tax=Flammeovirga sp. OC4 TaxID=1382345 RepID=UPI000A779863|nr:L,D-transpeptidase family protein [Flammeovirga sp. OC4]
MLTLLESKTLDKNSLKIYIRAFKKEGLIELWGKDKHQSKYTLIKSYDVCSSSGEIGPKRQQGDLQVPEGYYHIDRFNPNSNFYLSLGINYPNRSDEILGVKNRLGGDIFIHGNCVTIGCLPITDDQIKELYIFCIEAKNSGQSTIPVTIFPTKLTDENYKQLMDQYKGSSDKVGLWEDLKKGYDIFNKSKSLPSIAFLSSGRHKVYE